MADDLADMFDVPEEPPGKQRTITEEFLQIVEEFGDYIDKFMFEIVTFLAVIDSSMGLMKDVLGLFGFEGWRMAFFPSFSFIVTTSVFLFGSKKRKGKRDAEQSGGLGQALEMFEDVVEVMDDVVDVVDELEEGDKEGEGGVEGEGGGGDEQLQGEPEGGAPVNENQAKIRQVLGVVMLIGGVVAKLRKRKNAAQEQENGAEEGESQAVNISGANTQTAANTSALEIGTISTGTGGLTGLASLDTCGIMTTNSTTKNTGSVVVDLHGASSEVSEAVTVAKQQTLATTRAVWGSSLEAARNVEHDTVVVTNKVQQEASGVAQGVGREVSQIQQTLQQGTAGMAAGNMAQGTAQLAGSLSSAAGKATAGAQEAQKRSGGLIPIVIRMVRLVVRVANRGKSEQQKNQSDAESSPKETRAGEEDKRHEGVGDLRGSSTSLNCDRESIYYDCESQFTAVEAPTQTRPFRYVSRKSIMSTGTQTDEGSSWSVCSPWQSHTRLQELESRVLELESEITRAHSRQQSLTDLKNTKNGADGVSQNLQGQTRSEAQTPDKKSANGQRDASSKSWGKVRRDVSTLHNTESQASRMPHQKQLGSGSLLGPECSGSQGVEQLGRRDKFDVDAPVIVHHGNARTPHGHEGASHVTYGDFPGRAGPRQYSNSQATSSYAVEANASSTEDLEAGHSHFERSALSLSSVRFIDEAPGINVRAKEISYRQGHQNVGDMRHRGSTRSKSKAKYSSYPRLAPQLDSYENYRFPHFSTNDMNWHKSDTHLVSRKRSMKNQRSHGRGPTDRERYSSEWKLRHESHVLNRQSIQASGMTRSPSTLHRSHSSCFGDDESL